jgi:hypothetical protein
MAISVSVMLILVRIIWCGMRRLCSAFVGPALFGMAMFVSSVLLEWFIPMMDVYVPRECFIMVPVVLFLRSLIVPILPMPNGIIVIACAMLDTHQ